MWLVFSCGLFLALFALAVNHARLWNTRVELQNNADAAVLAAAAVLVDDDLLRGDPAFLPALLQRSEAEAQRFAQFNLVQAQPFSLQSNPTNHSEGDLVFGTLDVPRSRQLVLGEDVQNPANASLASINAVRVRAALSRERGTAPGLFFGQFVGRGSVDVRAEAAVMLDRDVIGFRPRGDKPLPLAPLGLFSDPSGSDPRSWQNQVEMKNGADDFRYDRVNRVFVAGAGDGLYEMHAVLALDASQTAQGNVSLLYLGVSDAAGISQQLISGVASEQLENMGGNLVLRRADNRLPVPGANQGPPPSTAEAAQLFRSLDQVRALAEPRLWPLYCGLDSNNQPILCGFVAARVVTVTPLAPHQPLSFVLQPTMVSTANAVTDAGQRGIGGIAITNPYICKIRLVE
jgi:hypothetical protein